MPNWETVYYHLVGLCSQQTKLVFVFPASHSNCLKAPGFLSAGFAAMASDLEPDPLFLKEAMCIIHFAYCLLHW